MSPFSGAREGQQEELMNCTCQNLHLSPKLEGEFRPRCPALSEPQGEFSSSNLGGF